MAPTNSPPSGTALGPSRSSATRRAPQTLSLPRVERPATLPPSGTSLLLFAGKGGVGKTTLASATALRLAQDCPGSEVLLFSADPAHSLSDCLATPVGPRETRIDAGLTALELDAEAEFERFQAQYADEIAGLFGALTGGGRFDLALDREVAERLIDLVPPGLDEVMALAHATALLQTQRYDRLVIDAPPTGHLMRLLELPELIEDWLRVFFHLLLKYRSILRLPKVAERLVELSKNTKALRALLADPARAQLFAVATPSELSLREAQDLLAACARMGVHVPVLFVNLATLPGPCELCGALARAESAVRRRFEAAFGGVHRCVVYRWQEPRGPDRLAALGRALYVR